jgi:hypothetical protein
MCARRRLIIYACTCIIAIQLNKFQYLYMIKDQGNIIPIWNIINSFVKEVKYLHAFPPVGDLSLNAMN